MFSCGRPELREKPPREAEDGGANPRFAPGGCGLRAGGPKLRNPPGFPADGEEPRLEGGAVNPLWFELLAEPRLFADDAGGVKPRELGREDCEAAPLPPRTTFEFDCEWFKPPDDCGRADALGRAVVPEPLRGDCV
jgi:hypothetical protein